MEALADEFGDKREILWAKLYGYQPYNLVAFEDLTVSKNPVIGIAVFSKQRKPVRIQET